MNGLLFVRLAVLAWRVVKTTAASFKRLCTSCDVLQHQTTGLTDPRRVVVNRRRV